MIETRGIATVVIGLVRPHLESTKSPRSLWVPFPLGRPLGEPEDPAFQRRVLMAALGLLERRDGPVLLVDFPDDAPSMTDTAGWTPLVDLPPLSSNLPGDAAGWAAAVAAEIELVRPHWGAAQRRFGRTTVGLSHLPPEQWGSYAAGFLDGDIPTSAVEGLSPALLLRCIADDIKALYGEAVQAAGPQPSGLQVNRWFWNRTLAGQLLRALRMTALTSTHNGFNTVGARFIVPGPWVAPS
jgi:hypothetical protein